MHKKIKLIKNGRLHTFLHDTIYLRSKLLEMRCWKLHWRVQLTTILKGFKRLKDYIFHFSSIGLSSISVTGVGHWWDHQHNSPKMLKVSNLTIEPMSLVIMIFYLYFPTRYPWQKKYFRSTCDARILKKIQANLTGMKINDVYWRTSRR